MGSFVRRTWVIAKKIQEIYQVKNTRGPGSMAETLLCFQTKISMKIICAGLQGQVPRNTAQVMVAQMWNFTIIKNLDRSAFDHESNSMNPNWCSRWVACKSDPHHTITIWSLPTGSPSPQPISPRMLRIQSFGKFALKLIQIGLIGHLDNSLRFILPWQQNIHTKTDHLMTKSKNSILVKDKTKHWFLHLRQC